MVASADHLIKFFCAKPRGKNYCITCNFFTVVDVKHKSKICFLKFALEKRTRSSYNQKPLYLQDNSSLLSLEVFKMAAG